MFYFITIQGRKYHSGTRDGRPTFSKRFTDAVIYYSPLVVTMAVKKIIKRFPKAKLHVRPGVKPGLGLGR